MARQKINQKLLFYFSLFFLFLLFLDPIIILAEEDFLSEEELTVVEERISLEPPIITEIPKKIEFSENLTITGLSVYPNIIIRIFIQEDEEQPIVKEIKTDREGKWRYFHTEPIKEGNYTIWAMVVDDQMNQSQISEKFFLKINPKFMLQIFKGPTLVIIFLLLIIFILLICLIVQKRRDSKRKRILKNELEKSKKTISKVFKALKQEAKERISEKKSYGKIKEALLISEKLFEKEIKDIKKKLK